MKRKLNGPLFSSITRTEKVGPLVVKTKHLCNIGLLSYRRYSTRLPQYRAVFHRDISVYSTRLLPSIKLITFRWLLK